MRNFKKDTIVRKFIIAICILASLTNTTFGQHTDLKEYGLKGKVKNILTMHYKDVMFFHGQWLPISFEKFSYSTDWHFNENGFLDTLKTSILVNSDSLVTSILAYEFKNEKKISGKYFNYNGDVTELHKINWTDQYTYTTIATDTNGAKAFESTIWLSNDFRENKGDFKSYENGKLVFYEKYSDIFDSNGQLIKGEFTNIEENTNYFVLYNHIEFDENNNPIVTIQINITDWTIKKMTIRRIDYYE